MSDFYDLLGTPTSNSGTSQAGLTYTLSASSHYNNLDAYMAFGTNDNYESNGTAAAWIKIQFGEAIVITSFTFVEMTGSDSFGDFELQGSNDGTNWDDLYSYKMQLITASQTIDLGNSTGYLYYRFYNTSSTGNGSSWRRLKNVYLNGCRESELGDTYTIVFGSNNAAAETQKQTAKVDQSIALKGNSFVYKGYEFMGWSSTKTGAVEYADGATVLDLTGKDGTVNLYAIWRRGIKVVARWIKIEGRWIKL